MNCLELGIPFLYYIAIRGWFAKRKKSVNEDGECAVDIFYQRLRDVFRSLPVKTAHRLQGLPSIMEGVYKYLQKKKAFAPIAFEKGDVDVPPEGQKVVRLPESKAPTFVREQQHLQRSSDRPSPGGGWYQANKHST